MSNPLAPPAAAGQRAARNLADAIGRAARPGVLERDFRQAVEAHLLQLAGEQGIDLTPHNEVTLGSSGRADTIYNRFIIEWEKPGSLKPSNSATKNRDTIAQCQRYGESLFWVTRERTGRIVGCCTDLPSGSLADWKNLSADQLQARFADLGKAAPSPPPASGSSACSGP